MTELRSTWVFGKAAAALGLLGAEEAEESALTQEELEGEGISLRFGEVLVEGKVLTEKQVQEVLRARGDAQPDPDDGLFGAIAVENGFLELEDLEECLDIQQDLAQDLADPGQVPKIGEILLTEEKMEPAAVEAVLKVQERLKVGAFALTPSKMMLLKKKKTSLKVRSPEDALFCKAAVRRQMLSPQQVAEILQIQMEDPRPRTVGEIAYELEYMDQLDVAAVLEKIARKEGVKERRKRHQTTSTVHILAQDRDFADAALKNGFVDEKQLKKAEKIFKFLQYLEYPRSLGEIFYDTGILSEEQILAILDILRLKGAILPPYRLEEILLSDREDETLGNLVKAGDPVTQDQVTECLRIQRELRRVGIHRKIGEIMLVKNYLAREDLKRRPVARRGRGRRTAPADEKPEGKVLSPAVIVGGAVFAVVALVLVLALAFQGEKKKPPRKTDTDDTSSSKPDRPTPSTPGETGPKPGKSPEEQGFIHVKGRWVPKAKYRERERRAFYESLRKAVSGR
jgi:hypothetical protein